MEETKENVKKIPKRKKVIISILVLIILIVAAVIGISMYEKVEDNIEEDETTIAKAPKKGSKTVMIYMCGSDLESGNGLGTSNLNDLMNSDIDYKNINVLLCAGGSKRWYNSDISKNETSIFKVTEEELTKVKKQSKLDMAEGKNVTNFLDYVYDNYKTDQYYFMFWNHGMALAGLEYDELTKNELSLSELDDCLEKSKFHKANKKIDTVILNNCLMGSLETASILSKYANYLVASEDVMYGSRNIKTLEFLDGIKINDDSVSVGRSYIDSYSKSTKQNLTGDIYTTIALIDLSKVEKITENLNDYFEEIELNQSSFTQTVRIRDEIYEYQKAEDAFDMVDLYQLVSELGKVNSNNEELLDSIEEAVIYNSTTDPYSKGISIYFPETYDWTEIYNTIDFSETYKDFTQKYIDILTGKEEVKPFLATNEAQKIGNGFSLQLTPEEAELYKNSKFFVFEDNKDGTYKAILKSYDTSIDEKGVITANLDNKAIKVVDNSDGSEFALGNLFEIDKTDEYTIYETPVFLEGYDESALDDDDPDTHASIFDMASIRFKVLKNGNVEIMEIRKKTIAAEIGENIPNGEIIDLKDSKYGTIQFLYGQHGIELDESGNYLGIKGAGNPNTMFEGVVIDLDSGFTFKAGNLDAGKEYVGAFSIEDIYRNTYSSKLIKIEK